MKKIIFFISIISGFSSCNESNNNEVSIINEIEPKKIITTGSINDSNIKNNLRKNLYHELRNFDHKIAFMQTKKFKILLDYISEDSIRYACWSKDKKISEKPDLILKNGVLKYDGTGGNHSYFFKNYNYTYQCVINVLVPDEWPDAYLEIYNGDENILSQSAEFISLTDSNTSGWESPKNLFLVEDFFNNSIIIRAPARYYLGDGLNEEEMNWIKNTDTLQWWVLPMEGIAKKVNVIENFIFTTKLCGDYGNFYATSLDYDLNEVSLACLGYPPKSWFKKAPKCIISKDEAIQLINSNLSGEFQSVNNKFIITETNDGWDGYVNWCCPKEDNPLHEIVDEMSIVEYRIPVNVSAQSKITIGDAKAHILGGEGSIVPSLKRDIDGDGILEIFWTGCQNYWTHNDKTFVSNVGNCCGC